MIKKIFFLIILAVLMLSISACGTSEPVVEPVEPPVVEEPVAIELEYTPEGIITPASAQLAIGESANDAMMAIKDMDFFTLSELTHPLEGLRFTPYTYVSMDNDLVFTSQEVEDFFTDETIYLWGYQDGSGFDIELTPAEYYDQYIYTADFIAPEQISYNEVLSFGNMMENQFEVYEDAIVVEYYFSGFDPQYEGMDWQSLRLVFQEYDGAWLLVGIIHNQWTI